MMKVRTIDTIGGLGDLAIQQSGADTLILCGAQSLTLVGVDAALLTPDDFLFHT